MVNKNLDEETIWHQFFLQASLTESQGEQFKKYYRALVEANDIHNLTAITDLEKVVTDHFQDSLALSSFVDCTQLKMIGDVGTGAGFPALPLKIAFPHLHMILIEVNHKKIDFLHSVIELLGLTHIECVDLDWRTFLRKTEYDVDLFCARASLQPEELVRLFKPSSPYRDAQLAYWASAQWVAPESVAPFIKRDKPYQVGDKQRRLIFFQGNTSASGLSYKKI